MVGCMAELYFINANSRKNKELTDFIERNIDMIVKVGRLMFKPMVVETSQLDRLERQGITTFPAMRITGCPVFQGIDAICNELQRRVSQGKRPAAPKTPEESVSDWMMKEMGAQYDPREKKHILPNDDTEENLGDQLRNKFAAEQQRRAQNMAEAKRGPDHADGRRPAGPSWQSSIDDDRAPPQAPRQGMHTAHVRPDNLQAVRPSGDPKKFLQRGNEDDEMMRKLLDNMGGDTF